MSRDPVRESIIRFGDNAARRRDAARQGIVRGLIGGISFTSEYVLRQRRDHARALEDLAGCRSDALWCRSTRSIARLAVPDERTRLHR